MNKKRFAMSLLKAGVVLLVLSGCSYSVPVFKDGAYEMVMPATDPMRPNIVVNVKNKTFEFVFDSLSSYANIGTIVIDKDKVIGTTSDQKYTYSFVIVNSDTLRFDAAGSSEPKTVGGKIAVSDGSEFKYVEGFDKKSN